MGSTGTGNFSDYAGRLNTGNLTGDASGQDLCRESIAASIEEVERCDYYKSNNSLPADGTLIRIRPEVNVRIEVEVIEGGILLGYLPTRFNYITTCMAGRYAYTGIVIFSVNTPVPMVQVTISPE